MRLRRWLEREQDSSFEQNGLFDVKISVVFRHELVNKSTNDTVEYCSSPVQLCKLLRARAPSRNKDRENRGLRDVRLLHGIQRESMKTCTSALVNDIGYCKCACSQASRIILFPIT